MCHTPRTENRGLELIRLCDGDGKCHPRLTLPKMAYMLRGLVSLCLNSGFRTVRVRNRVKEGLVKNG